MKATIRTDHNEPKDRFISNRALAFCFIVISIVLLIFGLTTRL